MFSRRWTDLVVLLLTASCAVAGAADWPNYGHTPNRNSIAVDGPNTIDANTLAWIADEDPQDPNFYVEFESATGPVVYNEMVYAYAKYKEPNEQAPGGFDYTNSQVVAYDANSGEIEWATVIDKAIWDSWSTPCIDSKHNTVLMGSGDKVFALDAQSGAGQWAAQLEKNMLNASVCAALDIAYARAFITDYDGSGTTGKLYCINLDANEPNNPYEPGQIVWSAVLGATGGNSPAYKDGVVYVSSIKGPTNTTGTIYAYDAEANTPIELWQSTDANFDGFFGGVTVAKEGFLYAATYDWAQASEDNSTLCKIDCNDGSIVWTVATERTDSMPVVVGDKIYITGGLEGYGSRPKVEAYLDHGDKAGKLWETSAGMLVGGWTNQPAYANGKLYVGAIPTGGAYYTELYIFDVTITAEDSNLIPDDPNFIIGHYQDKECGNSPAVTYDSIYTIGLDGLFKFYQPALLSDISKDDKVDGYDLGELIKIWLYDGPVGSVRSDLDLDGDVDSVDFSVLAGEWKRQLN